MKRNHDPIATSLLLLLLLFLPTKISLGCGPVIIDYLGYSFVNPKLMEEVVKPAPFFLDLKFEDLYINLSSESYRQQQSNIKEWQSRVCEFAALDDIRYVIYGADVNELMLLQNAARTPNAPLPSTMKDNSFVDYLLDLDCKETIDYLVFAKRCEPHVISYANLWEQPERNKDAMQMLIDEGKRTFRRTNSHYIRLRYAYQVVRLAHYIKEHQYALDLYDFFLPKIDDLNSLIYYWLQGHYAGALRALGDHVKASYIYTTIFAHCPNRRASAYRSFLIKTDEEWEACYLMCKSKEERAAMFAIRAGENTGRVLEEMEKIYAIHPKSAFLELMLMREIRELESTFLGYAVRGNRRDQRVAQRIPKDKKADYLIELQAFARKCRQEQKVKNTILWQLAEGYLEFLAGDYYKARQTLTKVRQQKISPTLQEQLSVLDAILQLSDMQALTLEVEEELLAISKNEELMEIYPDFREYFDDRVAELYAKADRPGLAFRAHYSLSDSRYNPDIEIIEDLLGSLERSDEVSRFELLLGRDTLGEAARVELINQKATYYMARGRWREANAIWAMADRADWRKFGEFNIFLEQFRDCVHCDGSNERGVVIDTSGGFYTKGRITELILEKERDARLRGEDAEYLFYDVGLALYNMSYFGPAWGASDFFRSGASNVYWNLDAKNGVVAHPQAPFGNKENFDVSIARYYFEEARDLAKQNERHELAAKAAFMAAKCEQKQYFTSSIFRPPGYNQIPALPEGYDTNYRELSQLSFTDTYRRIIQECQYFAAYMR
ncbi:MAG: hypothetical protein AAF849_20680 [Bacteroidota bacterium]